MYDLPKSLNGRTAKDVALDIAYRAGNHLKEQFYTPKTIRYKGPNDIVTNVDIETERLIRNKLSLEFPHMGFLGEEAEGDPIDSGYVWIVDPVDGTRNYAAGIPTASVVIGLVKDGEILIGVNYDPFLNEMFHAEKGCGAFMNDRKLNVSQKKDLRGTIIATDKSRSWEETSHTLDLLKFASKRSCTIRIMGSSALAISYVAAGRYDLYFHSGLSPWDQVAGILLVEEAAGIVTDRVGEKISLKSNGIIAANESLGRTFINETEELHWRHQLTKNR